MNYEELAFTNQQLAGMLRHGIPLEGGLRQLCTNIKSGALSNELGQLERDLAKGVPLPEALASRNLPEFYRAMLQTGVQCNDLVGMLTLLADYYERLSAIWTRLKGLMVYPLIVFSLAAVLSVALAGIAQHVSLMVTEDTDLMRVAPGIMAGVVMPPVIFALIVLSMIVTLAVPWIRRQARWCLPGFKEAALSQFAASMSLMLKKGCHLGEALKLARSLDPGTPMARELAHWQSLLAAGEGKFAGFAMPGKVFSPLFIWLVGNSEEDLAAGFQRAAEVYFGRAVHRIDMMLYGALPMAVIFLGIMILCQVYPVMQAVVQVMNVLGMASQ